MTALEPVVDWVLSVRPTTLATSRRAGARGPVAGTPSRGRREGPDRIAEKIHPVAAIARVVEEEGADLAVLGTWGIGGFLGLRLGRVPVQVVHHIQLPVVLVPPPVPISPAKAT